MGGVEVEAGLLVEHEGQWLGDVPAGMMGGRGAIIEGWVAHEHLHKSKTVACSSYDVG
jgi:hypothetical protein